MRNEIERFNPESLRSRDLWDSISNRRASTRDYSPESPRKSGVRRSYLVQTDGRGFFNYKAHEGLHEAHKEKLEVGGWKSGDRSSAKRRSVNVEGQVILQRLSPSWIALKG